MNSSSFASSCRCWWQLQQAVPRAVAGRALGGHFPSDEAAIKLLYLGIRNVTGRHIDGDGLVLERGQRGTGTLGWKAAMNAFAVTFPDRVPV
jgi:transposase-like protein